MTQPDDLFADIRAFLRQPSDPQRAAQEARAQLDYLTSAHWQRRPVACEYPTGPTRVWLRLPRWFRRRFP